MTPALSKAGNIHIDLTRYLNNPVQDSYSSDGKAKYTTEPKLNGLFPNEDLLEKLKMVTEE